MENLQTCRISSDMSCAIPYTEPKFVYMSLTLILFHFGPFLISNFVLEVAKSHLSVAPIPEGLT